MISFSEPAAIKEIINNREGGGDIKESSDLDFAEVLAGASERPVSLDRLQNNRSEFRQKNSTNINNISKKAEPIIDSEELKALIS